MLNKSKMNFFRKTDTTLVYIATNEFAKEIMGEDYQCNDMLYIHVGRDKGDVIVYENNDPDKVVHLNMENHEFVLKCAEADR